MTRLLSALRRRSALLCLSSAIAAIAGAAAHPLEGNSFRSEAVIAVLPGPSGASSLRDPTRALAEVVELPQITAAAGARSSLAIDAEEVSDRVEVVDIGPGSGLVKLRGSGGSQSEADALVDAVAEEAVLFMRRTAGVDGNHPMAFLFDTSSLDGWLPRSPFSYGVRRISVIDGEGRDGTGAMGFQCAVEIPGCGPGVELVGPIAASRSYAGHAFARISEGTARLRLVLGSDSDDVAAGPSIRLDEGPYRRLDVSWVPARDVGTATLALQTTTDTAATVLVDSVSVATQPGRFARAETAGRGDRLQASPERRPRKGDRFVNLAQSAAAPAAKARTWQWALLGGLGGLVIGAAGLGTAALARQRRNEAERDPNA